MNSKRKPLAKTVKDTIDFVFEILTSNPGGYEMSARELGTTRGQVVAILVERGIIERNHAHNGKKSSYQWVAAMAPTKVLYGSVTQELADRNREARKKYYEKHKATTSVSRADKVVEVAVRESVEDHEEDSVVVPADPGHGYESSPLESYSIVELWQEIKRRGGRIEGGQLAITTYLD